MAYDTVLAERLHEAAPHGSGKKMFAGYGFFVDGAMRAGVSGDGLMVKLADTETALQEDGVIPFAPGGGKAMKGWVVVDAEIVAEDDALRAWLERAGVL